MTTAHLAPDRLARVKTAYTTRRVDFDGVKTLLNGERAPRSGDLLLARVAAIGQHKRIERPTGRQATLFVGDEVLVCYGHRYAPDQFEATIPSDLSPCHLVAAGGVAASVIAGHAAMATPTEIEPIGLLGDRDGRPVNLRDHALRPVSSPSPRPFTVAVVGTSMNAGKTDPVAHLVRGLSRDGRRVGVAKVTGTGAGKDFWLMGDAGADPVFDFTSAGYPSTYLASSAEVQGIFDLLMGHLSASEVDTIVLEVADGVYQRETADLVSSPRFADCVDGLLLAAGDALGATAGVGWLRERAMPVLGVAGLLTASPLAIREAEGAIGVPVFDRSTLATGEIGSVLRAARRPRRVAPLRPQGTAPPVPIADPAIGVGNGTIAAPPLVFG